MPQATELLQTVPATGADQLPAIDLYDRLDIVQRVAGFLATSNGELNKAFGLLDDIQKPWGAATHTREIGQHQKKHDQKPEPAQVAVVRELASYAGRARLDRTNLGTLSEEVAELSPGNPFAYIDERQLITGRGALVRYIDLRRLARDKQPDSFPFSPLRGYTPGQQDAYDVYTVNRPQPEVAVRITEVLGKIRRKDAMGLVGAAREDQVNRFRFWAARLDEIARHQMGGAGTAAKKSLASLGVKES